ncbi:glutamate 5-kinase [Paraglaciecola sp. L1A13]|uniref:glutamate 5-kinase n=1 Tax=Paraglaciecola sp. L1A13 TaxID=2686359 RepID=UPI00131A9959|nr:glutamate 5-kinase [Paraglaciecola sp. L1A13]|tara:strand:- start:241 stop:1347 length:1107 start_codon:yes stop_codon:yes gene_type:complete
MDLSQWKRVVIKVGSALIAPHRKGCSSHYLLSIAQFIVRLRANGVQVVLVSSGSVAAGAHLFPETDNVDIALKKAMAAAGQTEMMATWDRLFDFPTAQILLTHGDLRDRERYVSIRETIFSLLNNGVLPIINENDTVTTDDLKVGDNDNLSAMVAASADADALIICSDVDGLYDKNPNIHDDAVLLPEVTTIDSRIFAMGGGATSAVGTGGMKTKIEAAEKATSHGIDTFIVNGFKSASFNSLLEGKNPGTFFRPYAKPMQEHDHWMRHTASEQGEVVVNNDFDTEFSVHGEQLTSDEIVEVNGSFAVGDTILLRKDDGTRIAKARSNYSSCLLSFIADQDDREFAGEFQNRTGPIISKKNIASLEKQ